MKPSFAELGLSLENFVVENISLPDELQKMLDQRISMNMLGDMGKYTQFQVAQSLPIAAANEGGGAAGIGVGLGAGLTMANSMMNAMKPGEQAPPPAVVRRRALVRWRRPLRLRLLQTPSSAPTAETRSRAHRNSVRSAAPRNNRTKGRQDT